jgi:signal transduction histidine kinase
VISRDLSRSLSDIVWTLRPASADLPGFVQFLRQRASDLLSGAETAVEFDFPDEVPATPLRLEVRRQIHAIASEVLHNVAKHASATRVRVGLLPDGGFWILRISDDGVGFREPDSHIGLGLDSMRKRADIIGARLAVSSEQGRGSSFELRFSPQAEGGR